MHWSEEIAQRIIARNPEKEEYVCAAGISPSGSVHIGNFRDVATSLMVVRALQKKGKKAKLLFSWDEYDRCRKIPANVQAVVGSDYDKYIGSPYVDIPDPWGCHENYAKHFEEEFLKAMEQFGINLDCRYQADMYRSGKYTKDIIESLQKREEIFEILDSFKTKDTTKSEEQLKAEHDAEKAVYYPVSIFCSECHTDFTTITNLSEDCTEADYTCRCGHSGHFNFLTDFDCKLGWKIDWPMRWRYEKVDFEPGGKDHAAPTGSYSNSKIISKKIFGFEPPMFQGYEFIGIKGMTGKMSSSSGLNLTPETLLKLYQPEVILWLYSKTEKVYTLTAKSTEQTVAIDNDGSLRVVPVITTTGEARLVYGENSWTLSAGTYSLPDLALSAGLHDVKYSGSGTITITFREGRRAA